MFKLTNVYLSRNFSYKFKYYLEEVYCDGNSEDWISIAYG